MFLTEKSKAQTINVKTDIYDCIKIKFFFSTRIKNWEASHRIELAFAIHRTKKGGVNAEYKHRTVGHVQMAHCQMKNWSSSLFIREMHIKTIIIYHIDPPEYLILKRLTR